MRSVFYNKVVLHRNGAKIAKIKTVSHGAHRVHREGYKNRNNNAGMILCEKDD